MWLEEAKKRCEAARHFDMTRQMVQLHIINADLPTALAECEWSREMLGRAKEVANCCLILGIDYKATVAARQASALLHALEGKEARDAQDGKG